VTPYTVSIIGCGRIAFSFEDDPLRKKPASHHGALLALPDLFCPVSICDPDTKRLGELALRYPRLKPYTSHHAMLKAKCPDVVVISAPTSFHTRLAADAIQAGVRGIVLEKPVSASLKEARLLQRLQQEADIPILVFHERRYDPLYQWVQAILQTKPFGPLQSVYARLCSSSFPTGPVQAPFRRYGGGALVHDGTHMIDLLDYFLGPMARVSAHLRHQIPSAATETSITSLLFSRDGIPIHFALDGLCEYFHFEIELSFRSARIRVGNGIREISLSQPSRAYTGFQSLTPQPFPALPSQSPFTTAYRDLHQALTTQAALLSSLADGVRALETIYALYRSCRQSGRETQVSQISDRHPYSGATFFEPTDIPTL
jgi:predicted dehydrogenase